MPKKILEISTAQFNPYVRYVNRLEGATRAEHIVPWRVLYDFEIIFVTKGKLQVVTDRSEYVIEENCLHIMPPFVQHTRTVPENVVTNYYGVHLDFMFDDSSPDFSAFEVYQEPCDRKLQHVPILPDLAIRKNYKPGIMQIVESYLVKDAPRFVELFSRLYENYRAHTAEGALLTKGYMIFILAEFLADLRRKDSESPTYNDYVSMFVDYTMNHYSESIDLNKVVRDYGISPSRFRAIFKHQMNRAPHEYIIDYRMEQAKKLIASGKFNISEVSFMVGYDDIHYFSRLFKQKVGCTPTEYAEGKEN